MTRGALVIAGALLLAGCKKDPEAWARERYGANTSSFLAAAQSQAESLAMAKTTHEDPPRLPRPFVVLQRMPEGDPQQGQLLFHPLNAELPSAMIATSLDLVRGIVIVEKIRTAEAAGTMTIKRRTMTRFKYSSFYGVEFVDRNAKTLTVTAVDGHDQDKLKAAILGIPE